MSGYQHGVLIHNYNEDQFGLDLRNTGPAAAGARPGLGGITTTSRASYNWKQPNISEERDPPTAKSYVQRHLLFGHTGDMTDPYTNLQKTEFATCSRYFYQAPASVPYSSVTAEKFVVGDEPLALGQTPSTIADKMRLSWSGKVCPPPSDTFKTMMKNDFVDPGAAAGLRTQDRYPRHQGEFTKNLEKIKISRSQ